MISLSLTGMTGAWLFSSATTNNESHAIAVKLSALLKYTVNFLTRININADAR